MPHAGEMVTEPGVRQLPAKQSDAGSSPAVTSRQAAIDKLIADGAITQDADGTIRMTEKSWRLMAMQPTK